jgi:hypothetical protein
LAARADVFAVALEARVDVFDADLAVRVAVLRADGGGTVAVGETAENASPMGATSSTTSMGRAVIEGPAVVAVGCAPRPANSTQNSSNTSVTRAFRMSAAATFILTTLSDNSRRPATLEAFRPSTTTWLALIKATAFLRCASSSAWMLKGGNFGQVSPGEREIGSLE